MFRSDECDKELRFGEILHSIGLSLARKAMAKQRIYTKYKPEKARSKGPGPKRRLVLPMLLLVLAGIGAWVFKTGKLPLPELFARLSGTRENPVRDGQKPKLEPIRFNSWELNTRGPTSPPAVKPVTPPARKTNDSSKTKSIEMQPPPEPARGEPFVARSAWSLFEVQLALARNAISPGILDGLNGPQTVSATKAFQRKRGIEPSGEPDPVTKSRLVLTDSPYTTYTVTSNDVMRLRPRSKTWLGKSKQDFLEYESVLELVAEKSHAYPRFIEKLNPRMDLKNLAPGNVLKVPRVYYPKPTAKAASIHISLSGKVLQAFDSQTNLLVHFPCSIAAKVEKRPVGELKVINFASDPNYTFDSKNFPESPEARKLNTKFSIAPGPNNPVGTAWIGLDRPGYGIHGTPAPEKIGRTESHGCFRLANWDASYLLLLVQEGTPVLVEP